MAPETPTQNNSPRILPGYNQTSESPRIYVSNGNIKVSNRYVSRVLSITRTSNGTAGEYTISIGGVDFVKGSPTGSYTINDPRVSSTLSDFPDLIKLLEKEDKQLRQTTKYFVENNPDLKSSERETITGSGLYENVPSLGTNAEGQITETRAILDIEIKATNPSQNFGTMRYPLNSANTNLDYIRFQIFNPVPSKFDLTGEKPGQFIDKQYTQDEIGIIYLPIQPNINDINEVGWGEDNLNLMEMVAANLSLGFTGGTASTIEEIFKSIPDQIGKNQAAVEAAIRAFTASSTLTKSEGNIFTRTTGAMLNPNLELIFNSPKLRIFNYTIKFIPRSDKEGNMVRKIIRAFKQNMAPRVAASNYFIQTPHVFSIDYLFNGKEPHKGLNKIKKCALTNCSVNYTPGNNYMPYTDGTMTSYELTLQFQELDPIYDEDYMINDDIKLSNDEMANESIIPLKMSIGY